MKLVPTPVGARVKISDLKVNDMYVETDLRSNLTYFRKVIKYPSSFQLRGMYVQCRLPDMAFRKSDEIAKFDL